jgi:hypothetical protein
MRERLSKILVDACSLDSRYMVLSGDHGYALFDALRTKLPQSFVNVGVMEQAMVGMAAGLAKAGLRPIVYGLSAFVPIRVLEQIKMDVCHMSYPGDFSWRWSRSCLFNARRFAPVRRRRCGSSRCSWNSDLYTGRCSRACRLLQRSAGVESTVLHSHRKE